MIAQTLMDPPLDDLPESSPDRESDAAAIEGHDAESGPGSFEEVYEEHVEFVWRGLRRLGVSEAELDDAVQDVFVVVHRKLGGFEGRSQLRTWLFGIVLRTARSHRRTKRRRPEDPIDASEELGLTESAASRPDRKAESNEAVKALYELLDELDEEKREAFVLTELEELSAPEISEALGLNVNTVYARIRAARKAFEQAVSRRRAQEDWRIR